MSEHLVHKFWALVIIVTLSTAPHRASSLSSDDWRKTRNCWVDAGNRYGIDPWLLYSIAEHESGLDPLVVNNKNRDKSRDVGLMQINSFWFPELEKYGVSESNLFDPCTNIQVGAWILAQSIEIYGNTWRAVGAYNAGTGNSPETEALRRFYLKRIWLRYQRNVRKVSVDH